MSESGRGFNQRVILENLVSGYPSSLTHRSVQAPSAVHYRSLGGWAYSTSGFLPTHSGEGSNRTMRHLEHPAQWPTLTSTTAISFVNTLIMALWRYRIMHLPQLFYKNEASFQRMYKVNYCEIIIQWRSQLRQLRKWRHNNDETMMQYASILCTAGKFRGPNEFW